MGPLGWSEMIFIFVAALVVFGPKKLPELGKKLGQGMSEFRRASNELKSTFQREMDNIERETRMQDVRQAASDVKKQFDPTSYYDGDGDGDDDYYDEYDYESESTKSVNATESSESSESSSSTGDSTDSATDGAETPSADSSNKDVETASTSSPEAGGGAATAEKSSA